MTPSDLLDEAQTSWLGSQTRCPALLPASLFLPRSALPSPVLPSLSSGPWPALVCPLSASLIHFQIGTERLLYSGGGDTLQIRYYPSLKELSLEGETRKEIIADTVGFVPWRLGVGPGQLCWRVGEGRGDGCV